MSTTSVPSQEDGYDRVARVTDRLLEPVVIIDPDTSLRYANGVAAVLMQSRTISFNASSSTSFIPTTGRASSELAKILGEDREAGFTQFRLRGNSSRAGASSTATPTTSSTTPTCAAFSSPARRHRARARLPTLRTLSECND